jgi:hypothetical protein
MLTHARFERPFADAGVPAPTAIDLLSGATLFVARRPA